MKDLDIRLWGCKSWTAETASRQDGMPGRIAASGEKLCVDEEQHVALLGALLERFGTAYAVRLGPINAWVDAVEQRLEDLAWDRMPTVGNEQFWRPATQRLSFRRQLELRADVKLLYERSRQRRLRPRR